MYIYILLNIVSKDICTLLQSRDNWKYEHCVNLESLIYYVKDSRKISSKHGIAILIIFRDMKK